MVYFVGEKKNELTIIISYTRDYNLINVFMYNKLME